VRRLVERDLVSGETLYVERVGVVFEQRHDVVDPALDVGLPLSDDNALVEQLKQVHRRGRAPVDAADRDRPRPAHRLDARHQGREPVCTGVLDHRPRGRVGQEAGDLVRHLADGRPMGLHPDRVDHRVCAPSVGHVADLLGDVVLPLEIDDLDPVLLGEPQALRDEIDGDHAVAAVLGDA
jgi:hypothetical protein